MKIYLSKFSSVNITSILLAFVGPKIFDEISYLTVDFQWYFCLLCKCYKNHSDETGS